MRATEKSALLIHFVECKYPTGAQLEDLDSGKIVTSEGSAFESSSDFLYVWALDSPTRKRAKVYADGKWARIITPRAENLKDKVKNCHNTNSIFNTNEYVLLSDAEELAKQEWNKAITAAAETMNNQDTLRGPQQVILKLLKP